MVGARLVRVRVRARARARDRARARVRVVGAHHDGEHTRAFGLEGLHGVGE